jgi:hypothetical protein
MSLALTQPVTEMSTRDAPEGKERPMMCETDNLTAIYEPIIWKM